MPSAREIPEPCALPGPHSGKIWSQVLQLPGKEVTNLSCLTPDGKGIRALAESHKGTSSLYLCVQLSPHMNSTSILSQLRACCLSWLGLLGPTAIALGEEGMGHS